MSVTSGTSPAVSVRRLGVGSVVRGIGWLLVAASTVVLLYVVYLLWFTGLATAQAQRELAVQWSELGSADAAADPPVVGGAEGHRPSGTPPVAVGDAFAALWFERDGQRVVHDDVLYVVEGAAPEQLRDGPGHYPASAAPGSSGNVAIAGHRTTHGAPFWSLNELRHGDMIHLVDVHGTEWVYRYVRQEIVGPNDIWVIGDDPLGTAVPTLTLTTCHPRHSGAQRLIVWAELADMRQAAPLDAPGPADG